MCLLLLYQEREGETIGRFGKLLFARYYPYTDVKLPKYIRDRLLNGETLYYWQPHVERFGWCVIEPLRSAERASSYITKYIGKGFANDDRFKNVQMIKSSVGLKRTVKLKKGFTSIRDVKPSFKVFPVKIIIAW